MHFLISIPFSWDSTGNLLFAFYYFIISLLLYFLVDSSSQNSEDEGGSVPSTSRGFSTPSASQGSSAPSTSRGARRTSSGKFSVTISPKTSKTVRKIDLNKRKVLVKKNNQMNRFTKSKYNYKLWQLKGVFHVVLIYLYVIYYFPS